MRDAEEKRFCEALLERASRELSPLLERGTQLPVRRHRRRRQSSTRDDSIRPNQILAVSLPYCALPPMQMRAVVERCGRESSTSYGLRSLSPRDPGYIGRLPRAILARDAAYHHGHGVGLAARALRARALSACMAMLAWRSRCSSPFADM